MADRLRRGAIRNNEDLFRVVVAVEGHSDDEEDPTSKVRSYLHSAFKDRSIPWPPTPEAWDRLFDL